MKIKTSIRAGSGGASGAGGNSVGVKHTGVDSPVVAVPPPVYVPGVSRCAGF